MRTDDDVKRDAENELRGDPNLAANAIRVRVQDSVVTLTGSVRSYNEKLRAEADARRVPGVRGLSNQIDVAVRVLEQRPDTAIERDAVLDLEFEMPSSSEDIGVIVRNGWVILHGTIRWSYQRDRAAAAVSKVRGIKGLTNLLELAATNRRDTQATEK